VTILASSLRTGFFPCARLACGRALAALLVVTTTSVLARPARAGDDGADTDARIKRALELRRERRDREALDELHRVTEKTPRLMVQIGLAEQALGLWPAAERDVKEGLARSSDPWIKKNAKQLEESLQIISSHLATLDVWGVPDGAEVQVNGEVLGRLPLPSPRRVPAGSVRLTVRAGGYESLTKSLEMRPGDDVREHVVLSRLEVSTPPPAVLRESASASLLVQQPEPATKAEDHGSIFGKWWFWTAAGVVVAGASVGLYLALRKGDTNMCLPSAATTCSQW